MLLNRKSPDVFKDVAEFTELAQADMLVPFGALPNPKAMDLAVHLIEEECNKEYIPALKKYKENPTRENLIAVIDGAMDSIYVIAWAMRVLNVDSAPYWNEVHRSNMAKFPIAPQFYGGGESTEYEEQVIAGRIIKRNKETGKIMKPEGWTPPDLFGVIEALERIHKLRTMPDITADRFFKEYFHDTEKRREEGKIVDV